MKKIIIFFVTIFSFNTIAFAANNWIFKIGFNKSALRERQSNTYNSLSWGIERDIQLTRLFSVGAELFYTKNKVRLDNIIFWTDGTIFNSDVDLSNRSLDFGIVMILNAVNKNNFLVSFGLIPSACINISSSEIYWKNSIKEDPNSEKYEFVLLEGLSNFYPNFSLKMNFSAKISHKHLYFGFRYMYNFQTIGQASMLSPLNYRFNSIHFLIGIKI